MILPRPEALVNFLVNVNVNKRSRSRSPFTKLTECFPMGSL